MKKAIDYLIIFLTVIFFFALLYNDGLSFFTGFSWLPATKTAWTFNIILWPLVIASWLIGRRA